MKYLILCLSFTIAFLTGCSNPAGQDNEKRNKEFSQDINMQHNNISNTSDIAKDNTSQQTTFKPFYIFSDKGSRNNHYIPSGFMPNGKCLKLNDAWTTGCFSGNTCVKVVFDTVCSRDDQKWGGIYWLNPPNNWGSRKGGYNLTGAKKLTFWVKGEKGGEQIEEFKVGGIEGNYPDTDVAVIGPIILSNEWKQYSIDLRGKDLSYISGGFAWSATEDMNLESCTFYMDEMKFE